MILKLGFHGPSSDLGSHYFFEAELEVTDETAEFVGRDFARLVYLAERGMADGQRIAYSNENPDDLG